MKRGLKGYKFVAETYDEEWYLTTPALAPDQAGGFVTILENKTICMGCGGVAVQRMSYVGEHTEADHLVALGVGASVKHYSTECKACGDMSVS